MAEKEYVVAWVADGIPEVRGNVVRCKDCKHGKIHGIDVECVAHEEVSYDPEPWHPLDWFCADGERKSD